MKPSDHKSLTEAIKLVSSNQNYDKFKQVLRKHGYDDDHIANNTSVNPFADNSRIMHVHDDDSHWVNRTEDGGWQHHFLYHPQADERIAAGIEDPMLITSGKTAEELDAHLTNYHKLRKR